MEDVSVLFEQLSVSYPEMLSVKHAYMQLFGDISVSLRRIWTKLDGNYSYKPPRAPHIAQDLRNNQKSIKTNFFSFEHINTNLDLGTWTSVSRPLELVLGRNFHAESEFEVQICQFRAPASNI